MDIRVSLDGNKRVTARFPDGKVMVTDQPAASGGLGEFPSPFAAFLGAIATCAGVYVEDFCAYRAIPADGIELFQQAEFTDDSQGKRTLSKVIITLRLPPEFPEKYRAAVARAAELCAVKKAIGAQPLFEVKVQV